MKKQLSIILLGTLFLSLAGCSTLPKKFIRKKKEPDHKPAVVFLEEGPFQKKYSNAYYYKTHYTLWKTWQDEILSNLGGNGKKLNRSTEEAYSHLEQMYRYLKPEKQAQLKPLLDELKGYMDKFDTTNVSRTQAASMRSDLERLRRLVANDFYYDKVQSDLLADGVDLAS